MLEDKIFNSSYNNIDYGLECTTQPTIAIHSDLESQYEDNLSDDMSDVYTKKRLHEDMSELYEQSEFFEKYGRDDKKIDRGDIFDIYYTFKEKLKEKDEYNIIQIFCEIAEFFSLSYKTLYNDVITLEDKVEILDALEKDYGLERQFAKSKRLF